MKSAAFNEANSNAVIDTLNISPYDIKSSPAIFETAFFKGTKANYDTIPIEFYAVDIGKINIESGKIIACDPILMHDAISFSQVFPKGEFPIHLSIAKFNGDERVAFSRILFSNKPVAKWEFALRGDEKQLPIFGQKMHSYSVDGGIGLFIDERGNAFFNELYKRNSNIWEDVFNKEMDKNSHSSWQYVLYNFEGHNLASFSTGVGDGHYATYVGYDEQGSICRLLTDFALIVWWKK